MLAAGTNIPPAYAPPELLPGATDVYSAFWELSSDRQIGMAVGPVPWSSIDRWLRRKRVTDAADIQVFIRLIREMDEVYLGHDPAAAAPVIAPPLSLRELAASLSSKG